ncbi:MAG: hypothetical protein CSA96_01680 [Bacteroidetes bacterium]|nr:MAG: hypothetical protein CSA96_01680 [Bacteroidota bacterium]
MSDRLEEFVVQHRADFDRREPDPSIWMKIHPEPMMIRPRRKRLRWLSIAAAVAMLFGGTSAGLYFLKVRSQQGASAESGIYREIEESEQYYTQVLALRYEELRPYLAADQEAALMLQSDMKELDQVYAELKDDLKDNASNPEVIEAMILNYRVKLEILEDLLLQLKEKENQDYEKSDAYAL